MKKEDPETGFDICPGKYFDRMVFTAVDERAMPPYGGDCNTLIWRLDGTDEWRMSYRTRHYAGPNSDPFTGGDKKHFTEVRGDLHALRLVADGGSRAIAEALGGKVLLHETVKIEGDWKAFEEKLMKNPPSWIHAKHLKANQ